jgi:hypothetical protein
MNMKFDVPALMKMWIVVFWVMVPCSLVGGYQRFWRNLLPLSPILIMVSSILEEPIASVFRVENRGSRSL